MSTLQKAVRGQKVFRLRVRGVEYRVHVCRVGNELVATAQVPTRLGPVQVQARVDAEQLRQAMLRVARSGLVRDLREVVLSGDDAEIGDALSDFGDFFTKTIPREVKKVARSKVFRDVAKGINTVTDHPAYNVAMAAVNVIPGYGQAISAGMMGVKVAAGGMNLLARGKGGDKVAVQAIQTIATAAKAGNPKAQQAFGTLQALNNMPALQKGQPVPATSYDAMLMQGVEALGNQFQPGFVDSREYQAMKALYAMGKGVADIATNGGASAAMSFGGDVIPTEIGADGSYRVSPAYFRRARYGLPPPRTR